MDGLNSELIKQCQMCNSFTVSHDRKKGNVKCFRCGYIVEDHFQSYEQEVNNYDNDPTQINNMRGLVPDGREEDIKLGDRPLNNQGLQKNKTDEKVIKIKRLMKSWCEKLYLDKKDICLVEKYFCILTQNIQKQTEYQIKSSALLAVFIASKILKLDEEVFNLENLCNVATLNQDKVEDQQKYICSTNDEIKEILQPPKNILDYAEQYASQAKGLSDQDIEGFMALCKILQTLGVQDGEKHKTIVCAALYCVIQLSNSFEAYSQKFRNGEYASISLVQSITEQQSMVAVEKFYEKKLLPERTAIFEKLKSQVKVDWKSYQVLKRKQGI